MTTRLPKPPESVILAKVHQAMAATGRVVLWRNNSGALPAVGRAGKVYPMRFGLGVGGADLVGLLKPHGRFFALEIKTATGKQTREQLAWANAVQAAGGFYRVVRSVEEALEALDAASRSADPIRRPDRLRPDA
jgi:hypothetical protein